MKKFYRVCNLETKQGLWYNYDGSFTGLIHNAFNFCQNATLAMDFDEELCGYMSVTDDYNALFKWFTKEDILKLQEHGYFIHAYESEDFKFYERFQHFVINQETAQLVDKIILMEDE